MVTAAVAPALAAAATTAEEAIEVVEVKVPSHNSTPGTMKLLVPSIVVPILGASALTIVMEATIVVLEVVEAVADAEMVVEVVEAAVVTTLPTVVAALIKDRAGTLTTLIPTREQLLEVSTMAPPMVLPVPRITLLPMLQQAKVKLMPLNSKVGVAALKGIGVTPRLTCPYFPAELRIHPLMLMTMMLFL
jgi:hypothetical protein